MTTTEYEAYCRAVSAEQELPDDFFRKALEYILAHYGHVCEEFEVCRHVACSDSCGSYLTALNALEIADSIGQPTHDDLLGF